MNPLIELVSHHIQNSGFVALFLDTMLKSFVVLTLAGALCLFWRRASAATRHLIWFWAVISLPCLPLFSSIVPSWHRPLWSVSTGLDAGNQVSLTLELVPPAGAGSSVGQTPASAVGTGTSRADSVQYGRTQGIATHVGRSWLVVALLTWLGGLVLNLVFMAVGQLRLESICRKAQLLWNGQWTLLLGEACETLRLSRTVTLLQSLESVMPLTWGGWRPFVLLPAEADQWPVERRRVVLLHELAHVKRWDCLTQMITRIICAFYWFNPLVWLAARRMCVERERACDDLVLTGGWKASDYASHLVEIARLFHRVPQVAAIAMARPSQLGKRVEAIVDAKRNRRRIRPVMAALIAVTTFGFAVAVAANKSELNPATKAGSDQSRFDPRLQAFFGEEERHAHALAQQLDITVAPEIWDYFKAGVNGDWLTVSNLYQALRKRAGQYVGSTNGPGVATPVWQTIIDTACSYEAFAGGEKKYVVAFANDIIKSIPRGSIYFGGTDPGRTLITAFSKSHETGDPFFTLTQNALANENYQKYLRAMYGGKIYISTEEDSQKCFQEYMMDAEHRLAENKLKPGEDITKDANGKINVRGQIAVMTINGLITKVIFDRNTEREFYIEESFALDWMYPHLEPHGLIMKLNRQPLAELPNDVVRKDHEYWTRYVTPMIGDWITYDTPLSQVVAFAKKVHLERNLSGFKGDPQFVQNHFARAAFSKLRSSIGGIYAWRVEHAASESEKARMAREADFAFRQAFALCPYSPEVVHRYVVFLAGQKRISDAIQVAETAAEFPAVPGVDPGSLRVDPASFRKLAEELKGSQPAK
jgi:beta-lactamase regulating signal transducer with metallopeptidase domain